MNATVRATQLLTIMRMAVRAAERAGMSDSHDQVKLEDMKAQDAQAQLLGLIGDLEALRAGSATPLREAAEASLPIPVWAATILLDSVRAGSMDANYDWHFDLPHDEAAKLLADFWFAGYDYHRSRAALATAPEKPTICVGLETIRRLQAGEAVRLDAVDIIAASDLPDAALATAPPGREEVWRLLAACSRYARMEGFAASGNERVTHQRDYREARDRLLDAVCGRPGA